MINCKNCRIKSLQVNNLNLQQIKSGGLIRNAFIADEGRLLAFIDFSQQELRWLAELSRDPVLIDVFKNDKDVHSMTACSIFNMLYPDKTLDYDSFCYHRNMFSLFQDKDGKFIEYTFKDKEKLQLWFDEGKINTMNYEELKKQADLGVLCDKHRRLAKTVIFGVVYGISAQGLSDQLSIPEEEAQLFIDTFYFTYKGVDKWVKAVHKKIVKQRYVETVLGRKRRLYPYLEEGIRWKIEKANRMGPNAMIQGSSCDQIKISSLLLQPLLKEFDAHIVLWAHDENAIDVPETIGMDNLRKLAKVMEGSFNLVCGMKSDIEVGKKWDQKMKEDEIEKLRIENMDSEPGEWTDEENEGVENIEEVDDEFKSIG